MVPHWPGGSSWLRASGDSRAARSGVPGGPDAGDVTEAGPGGREEGDLFESRVEATGPSHQSESSVRPARGPRPDLDCSVSIMML